MIREEDPCAEFVIIAYNGELIGCVKEADPDQGYLLQHELDPETMVPTGKVVRKEGKIAILGNTLVTSREDLLVAMNKHRADCGLGPYGEDR